MTSVVSICNMALSNIAKDGINELNEPTPQAKACNQFYAHTRDLLLQQYPWRFAGKTIALAQVANTKTGAWGYAFNRPNDCLKVRWVRSAYSDIEYQQTEQEQIANPFDIEGELFFCNLSPAFLRYTFRLTDPTKFPPLFVDALAWHLAVRLAMPVARDPKLRADAWQVARQIQGQAQEADANEVREGHDHSSELVEVRA